MYMLSIIFVGIVVGIHAGFIAKSYGGGWGLMSWLSIMAAVVVASTFKVST